MHLTVQHHICEQTWYFEHSTNVLYTLKAEQYLGTFLVPRQDTTHDQMNTHMYHTKCW